MNSKVRTIYYPKNGDFKIIEFDDGKQIGLTGMQAVQFQQKYFNKLENIKRAPILVKNLLVTKGFDYDEIYNITEKDNNYILHLDHPDQFYKITISPNELKVILNCEK